MHISVIRMSQHIDVDMVELQTKQLKLCYICKSTFDDSISMPRAVPEVISQLSVDMN